MPSTSNLVPPATIYLVSSGAMGIPENIRTLREAAGYSQAKLAAKAKVSQQLISQLERGENLTTKYLPQIAQALGKTVTDIDPSFALVEADPVARELAEIYLRLHDHPSWQQYLLDQARALERRGQGTEAPTDETAKAER